MCYVWRENSKKLFNLYSSLKSGVLQSVFIWSGRGDIHSAEMGQDPDFGLFEKNFALTLLRLCSDFAMTLLWLCPIFQKRFLNKCKWIFLIFWIFARGKSEQSQSKVRAKSEQSRSKVRANFFSKSPKSGFSGIARSQRYLWPHS